jgi:hypothetical protein
MYALFYDKIKDLPNKEQLNKILEKRSVYGIIPKYQIFSNDGSIYDYTYQLDEDLHCYIEEFNKYYYPDNLLNEIAFNSISLLLSELEKILTSIENLDTVKYTKIEDCFNDIGIISNLVEHIMESIDLELFNSKKELFYETIIFEINQSFDITIESSTIDIWINDFNSINSFFIVLEDYIKKVIFPGYPNIDRNKMYLYNNLNQKMTIITKIINRVKWNVFSYEMMFLEKLQIYNKKYQLLVEDFSNKVENQFNYIESVTTDENNSTEIVRNIAIEYIEALYKIKNILYDNLDSRVKNEENITNKRLEEIYEEELNKLLHNNDNIGIKNYMKTTLGLYKLNRSLNKTFVLLSNI